MSLRRDKGAVDVIRDDQTLAVVDRMSIERGDIVVAEPGAVATMRLEGRRLLILGSAREQSEVSILGGSAVASTAGSLLAQAGERTSVMVGETKAVGRRSLFRVDRPFGTARAGVYRGSVSLEAPGSPGLELRRLFQSTVTANQLYEETPYDLRPDDQWDAHYLDSLVDLERNLSLYRAGYKDQLGNSLPSLDYFSSLVDADVGFMQPLVKRQSPKRPGYTVDLMVGLFVAKHAPGRLGAAFDRAWRLRREGGSWGVVAGILGLGEQKRWQPMVAQLASTIERSIAVAGGTRPETEFTLADGGDATLGDGGGPDSTFVPSDEAEDPADVPDLPPDSHTDAPPPPEERDDDDDGGGNPSPPPPPPCDLECQVKDIIPTPQPTSLPEPHD